MSTTSHPHGEERGKHPAREAPGEQGEVPRKRDEARMTKPILIILTMAVSVTRNGYFSGTPGWRAAE